MWGEYGFVGNNYKVIDVWKEYATNVKGRGLPCGHYIPEESPDETLKFLLEFLNEDK